MVKRLGLKLDFGRKIWWLPEKPQIEYKKIKPEGKNSKIKQKRRKG